MVFGFSALRVSDLNLNTRYDVVRVTGDYYVFGLIFPQMY